MPCSSQFLTRWGILSTVRPNTIGSCSPGPAGAVPGVPAGQQEGWAASGRGITIPLLYLGLVEALLVLAVPSPLGGPPLGMTSQPARFYSNAKRLVRPRTASDIHSDAGRREYPPTEGRTLVAPTVERLEHALHVVRQGPVFHDSVYSGLDALMALGSDAQVKKPARFEICSGLQDVAHRRSFRRP